MTQATRAPKIVYVPLSPVAKAALEAALRKMGLPV
jgi:hypothetical protein